MEAVKNYVKTMLYKEEELREMYNTYLKNKTHKGKPYTQYWFSVLLLEAETQEEIWRRERLPINRKKKIKVTEENYLLFKKRLSEWYNYKECESFTRITRYIFKRIEKYGERWRIT